MMAKSRNIIVWICFHIRPGNGLHVGHWRGYVISDVMEPLQNDAGDIT